MAIEADRTVLLADVDVTDEYLVEVFLPKKRTVFTPDEADAFAKELSEAAMQARLVLAEDQAARVTVSHEFDRDLAALATAADYVSPSAICQDCGQGKHGACIGSAFVESGGEIDEVECRCTEPGHRGRS